MGNLFIEKIKRAGVKPKVLLEVKNFCDRKNVTIFHDMSDQSLDELIEFSFSIVWLENGFNLLFDEDTYNELVEATLIQIAKVMEYRELNRKD